MNGRRKPRTREFLLLAVLFVALPLGCVRKAAPPGPPSATEEAPPEPFTGIPAYDEARSLLAHGKVEEAQKALEGQEPPAGKTPDLSADRIEFLLGVLSLRGGTPEAALAHFARLSPAYGRLPDYRLWFEAKALEALGRTPETYEKLSTLVENHPDSIWKEEALLALFSLAPEILGPRAAAEFAVDLAESGLFSSSAFTKQPGPILSQLASVLESAGLDRQALEAYEQLYTDYPGEPEAAEAREKIGAIRARLGLPVFSLSPGLALTRIKALLKADRTADAWNELDPLLDQLRPGREGELRAPYREAILLKGQILLERKRPDLAKKLYAGAISHGFDEDGSFRMRLADLAGKTSNEEAVEQYLLLLKERPRSPHAALALYQAGRLSQFSGDVITARSLFSRLVQEHPLSNWAELALFNQGWLAYRRGDFPAAIASFDATIKSYGGSSQYGRALYWGARCREMLEGTEGALPYYELLMEEEPTSYYGLLARLRTSGEKPFALLKAEDSPPFPAPPPEQQSEKWLLSLLNGVEGPARPFAAAAIELIALGLLPEAANELDRAAKALGGTPVDSRIMLSLFERADAWRSLWRWGARGGAGDWGKALPPATWHPLFPLAFPRPVEREARSNGLDPFLILAIMREESRYDPLATSWANARGLLQIIPDTGKRIAQAKGISGFDPGDLYDPETNIAFAAHYLSGLLGRFEGNFVYAVASYNGGPHNADKWRERLGDLEPEVFVEEIPFQETRDYVKKVYRSYALYRTIYGEGEAQASN
ncbi:MAG: transglycosylase SLT domain-containing protein [Bdellovibrionota bacterium]